MSKLGDYLSLVKFSHSVFALPFAMQGAWIGAFKLIWAGAIAGVISRTAPPQPA